METIQIEVNISRKLDIDVGLEEIIDGINSCKMHRRWNYIASILNEVDLNSSELTDEHKKIIKTYLSNKLKILEG